MGVKNWRPAADGGQKLYVPLCYFVDWSSPTVAPGKNVYDGSQTKYSLMLQRYQGLQQIYKQAEIQKSRKPKCLELY